MSDEEWIAKHEKGIQQIKDIVKKLETDKKILKLYDDFMNKGEIMSEEDYNPYCETCGTCGYIGCCGIRNFINEHIEGKTNCKNEEVIISELIDLCDYKDEVFKENKRLQEQIDKNLDELIKLEEMLLDYQGRLSLIKIHIKRLETLCVKDGCSFVNLIEVIKILDMIKGGNND